MIWSLSSQVKRAQAEIVTKRAAFEAAKKDLRSAQAVSGPLQADASKAQKAVEEAEKALRAAVVGYDGYIAD
jgi:multidrug resistance efflux pump